MLHKNPILKLLLSQSIITGKIEEKNLSNKNIENNEVSEQVQYISLNELLYPVKLTIPNI